MRSGRPRLHRSGRIRRRPDGRGGQGRPGRGARSSVRAPQESGENRKAACVTAWWHHGRPRRDDGDKLAAELDLGFLARSPWPVLHSTCRICGGLPAAGDAAAAVFFAGWLWGGATPQRRASREQAQVPSIGAEQRSRIARRAATARWSRLGRGVLTLAQIRTRSRRPWVSAGEGICLRCLCTGRCQPPGRDLHLGDRGEEQDDWAKKPPIDRAIHRPWATTPRKSSCTLRRGHLRGVEGSLRHPHYAVATEGIRLA